MVYHIVVYLFKHCLLSQLKDILQVTYRSLVFLAQVNIQWKDERTLPVISEPRL